MIGRARRRPFPSAGLAPLALLALGAASCERRADDAPPPLLAAGVVHDSLGRPVAGTSLGVMYLPPGRTQWAYWDWGSATDDEGRFAIHMEPPPGPARLHVLAAPSLHWKERPPIEPGATGVEIVYDAPARVEGLVLLDADAPWRDLRFELSTAEGTTELHPRSVEGGLELYERVPAPGHGRLRVRDALDDRTLYESGAVELRPGDLVAAPDVRTVDLRGRLEYVVIDVTTAEGDDVPLAAVRVLRADGSRWESVLGEPLEASGRRFATLADRALDVVAWVEGFEVVTARGVEGRLSLELARASSAVRLRLDPRVELAAEVGLHWRLEWLPAWPWPALPCTAASARELPMTRAVGAGRYRVVWFGRHHGGRPFEVRGPELEVRSGERLELALTPPDLEGR